MPLSNQSCFLMSAAFMFGASRRDGKSRAKGKMQKSNCKNEGLHLPPEPGLAAAPIPGGRSPLLECGRSSYRLRRLVGFRIGQEIGKQYGFPPLAGSRIGQAPETEKRQLLCPHTKAAASRPHSKSAARRLQAPHLTPFFPTFSQTSCRGRPHFA